jgi:hypothetical protein
MNHSCFPPFLRKADAAVGILIMTDYQIFSNFQDKLKVVSIVGDALSGLSSV